MVHLVQRVDELFLGLSGSNESLLAYFVERGSLSTNVLNVVAFRRLRVFLGLHKVATPTPVAAPAAEAIKRPVAKKAADILLLLLPLIPWMPPNGDDNTEGFVETEFIYGVIRKMLKLF